MNRIPWKKLTDEQRARVEATFTDESAIFNADCEFEFEGDEPVQRRLMTIPKGSGEKSRGAIERVELAEASRRQDARAGMTMQAELADARRFMESTPGIQTVARESLHPSPLNPRKHFELTALHELALNVRKNGIIQPIVVRPRPEGGWEIVCGERRWRATDEWPVSADVAAEMLPPLEDVQIIVREMDDVTALEVMLSENMQRNDLTVFEECDAFWVALGMGHSRESLATKISRDVAYVQNRLALKKMPKEARVEHERGNLSFDVLRKISRCPASVIPTVIEQVLDPASHDVWLEGHGYMLEPLNAEQTQDLIQQQFVRKLDGAPFPLVSETLYPVQMEGGQRIEGGSCLDCPWNSANAAQENVEPVKKRGAGRPAGMAKSCLHPKCFAKKVELHVALELMHARENGCTILSTDEAKKALHGGNGGGLAMEYVALDAEVEPHDLAKDMKKAPTWGSILDGEATVRVVMGHENNEPVHGEVSGRVGVEVIVAVDEKSGKVHRLVNRQQAIEAVKKTKTAKLLNLSAGRARSVQEDDAKKMNEAANDAARERREIVFALTAALVAAVEKKGLLTGFMDALAPLAASGAQSYGSHFVCSRRGWEKKPDVYEPIRVSLGMLDGNERLGLVVELLLSQGFNSATSEHAPSRMPESAKPFFKLYGVDAKTVEKDVKKQLAEARKAKKAESKKPKEKPPKKEPEAAKGKKRTKSGGISKEGMAKLVAMMKARCVARKKAARNEVAK